MERDCTIGYDCRFPILDFSLCGPFERASERVEQHACFRLLYLSSAIRFFPFLEHDYLFFSRIPTPSREALQRELVDLNTPFFPTFMKRRMDFIDM